MYVEVSVAFVIGLMAVMRVQSLSGGYSGTGQGKQVQLA